MYLNAGAGSFDERVGLTGISWGGYLTSLAMSLDDRLKLAVPVYGCGFLGDNSAWVSTFEKLGSRPLTIGDAMRLNVRSTLSSIRSRPVMNSDAPPVARLSWTLGFAVVPLPAIRDSVGAGASEAQLTEPAANSVRPNSQHTRRFGARASESRWIVGKGVLGLGDADREVTETAPDEDCPRGMLCLPERSLGNVCGYATLRSGVLAGPCTDDAQCADLPRVLDQVILLV